MARAGLRLSVRRLAALARISPNTVARFERGESLYARTIDTIRATLEKAGAEFLPEKEGGAGVRLRKVNVEAESHPRKAHPEGRGLSGTEARQA